MPSRIDNSVYDFNISIEIPDYKISCQTLPQWKRLRFGIEKLCKDELKMCEIPYLLDLFRDMDGMDIVFAFGEDLLNRLALRKIQELYPIYGYEGLGDKVQYVIDSMKGCRKLRFLEGADYYTFKVRVQEFEAKSEEEQNRQLAEASSRNSLDFAIRTLDSAKKEFEIFEKLFHNIQESQRILGEKVRDINEFGPDFSSIRSIFSTLAYRGRPYNLVGEDYTSKVGYAVFKATIMDDLQTRVDNLKGINSPKKPDIVERTEPDAKPNLEQEYRPILKKSVIDRIFENILCVIKGIFIRAMKSISHDNPIH